ncbi:MAG: ABC transporter permease [Lachnospiraceae bacterium]|nr:ABC transporter permease [Lachnospiraceae bacterium]
MYKLFFIAKNNMKKQKGDMITFFILTFIAAFLIFDCATILTGLGNVMDDRFEAVNGAHVMLMNFDTEAETDAAERAFRENTHLAEYERTPMLRFNADFKNKKQSEYMQYTFFAEEINNEKKLMTIQGGQRSYEKNDVLLPLNMMAGFAIGDTLQLKFGDDVYEFNVAGYLEDPYFCSTINITIYSICISPEMIDELTDKGYAVKRAIYKGRMTESAISEDFGTQELEDEIGAKYKEYIMEHAQKEEGVNQSDYMLVNWEMMRGGSQFIPMIVMAVMLAFAALIMLIALVIISFSIKNFIQKNLKNTGILEASGYTVKELRLSLVLQITLVAFAGTLAGMLTAGISFGAFGDLVSSILGLTWNQPVNPAVAVASLLGLILVVALVAASDSRAYGKITVLDALRGGIHTHNFKKNFFTFDRTPLPVPVVMALKEFAGGIGRNLLMVFIVALLVISTLIGFGMVDNFGKDPEGLLKIMAFEMADASVTVGSDEDLSEEFRELPGVESLLVQFSFEPTVIAGDEKRAVFTYAVDDMKNTKSTNMLEGRMPERANEILVTAGVADDLGLKCGDVVTIEYAGSKADFMISGINQRVERMGRTVYMRIDGVERILSGNLSRMYSYMLTAKEGVGFEELSAQVEAFAAERDLDTNILNERLFMENTMNTVSSSMSLICMAIAGITILIVIFVESLVIRAKISREWRGMGISKAIGQTTGGLLCQIMLSNLPAVSLGALIGVLLSGLAGGTVVKAAFSLFVVKNVCFSISGVWMLVSFAGIILTAAAAAALAGLKVRSLKPVEMITED